MEIQVNADEVGAEHVRGSVGGKVTLPCTYYVTGGTTSMCWGLGHCPKFKCLNLILKTDGKKVIQHQSEKYTLLGNITRGDVSLTITQMNLSDSGTYCCRVETPGLFNDQKMEIQVSVDEETTVNDSPAISTRTSEAGEEYQLRLSPAYNHLCGSSASPVAVSGRVSLQI
ncbi:hepatitis A virus cellular receptor 1 homolog [Xenopus laevis]|uniref:Hepatitis A virus cellular receptor 1 homolog n=2 Tax=Xenopus laevis TaxID=8355 RepID=A0A1L8GWA4_XENLA|nr:hepatitis A virus cellular receptor 1 homolog [Xenopus laevis]OCT88127.1 hypothetical protein XELAEV_18016756mg [Xenopus laevis]